MQKKDYAHQALVSVAFIFLVCFLNAVILYFFRLLIAKNLSVAEYGLFYAVFSFLSLIYVFGDLGFSQALVKYIPEFLVHKQEGKTKQLIFLIGGVSILLSLLITAILFLIAPWIAETYFHSLSAIYVLRFLSLVFFFIGLNYILETILRCFQRISLLGIFQLIRSLSLFLITAFLFHLGLKLNAPFLGYISSLLFASILLFPYIIFKIFAIHKVHLTWMGRENWKFFRYGMVVFISGFAGMLMQNIDTVMITYFRSLEETGLYNAAIPTAGILLFLSSAVTTVSFPLFSELWAARLKRQIQIAFDLIYKYAFLFSIPVLVLFLAFPELIIGLLFGEKFIAASLALQVLAIGTFFNVITLINFSFFNASGHQKYPLIMMLIASFANIIGNYLAIPRYGIIGAAITSAMCLIGMFTASIILVHRMSGTRIPVRFMIKNIFIGILFLIVVYFAKKIIVIQPLIEAVIVGIIGFAIYIALAFLFGLTSTEEIKWFAKKIIKRA